MNEETDIQRAHREAAAHLDFCKSRVVDAEGALIVAWDKMRELDRLLIREEVTLEHAARTRKEAKP